MKYYYQNIFKDELYRISFWKYLYLYLCKHQFYYFYDGWDIIKKVKYVSYKGKQNVLQTKKEK